MSVSRRPTSTTSRTRRPIATCSLTRLRSAIRASTPAKLVNRHWLITDANGKIQEVRGQGVVGEQPYLRPGEKFRYTSGTVIETPVGTMEGEYEMQADDGRMFLAPIDRFSLAVPRVLH
jgi:ApaG protein